MSNKNKQAQAKAIDVALEDMLEWYVAESGGKVPELAVDKKPYRGIVNRWFEPMLAGDNPCLVEEALGDQWTLKIVPIQRKLIT